MTLNVNLQLCCPWYAYIDQTAEAKIMQFSLKCSPGPYHFVFHVWLRNSKGVSLTRGLNLGWGGFWLRDAISRKRCEIELRWQLITNRKSYIETKVDDIEWPWTSIYCSVIRDMRVLTKRLRLESCVFCYKVAPHLSSLHIKFDDEIKGNPFKGQAYFPICLCLKLNWRLSLALFAARFRSYWDL